MADDELDLDLSAARAWSAFQTHLADVLEGMSDEDSLVIEVLTGEEPEDGSEPYVQFAGFAGDHLRGEVSGNRYLAAQYALDESGESWLADHGWQPDEHNYFVHLPTREGRRLAVMAVMALRDVFGVVHPAFLTTTNPDRAEQLGLTAAPTDDVMPVTEDEPIATFPTDRDHLVQLVDNALVPYFGHMPIKDSDGDIPVRHNSTLVFVSVDGEEPFIDLFSFVVRGITDTDAARIEVAILNRDIRFIKFVAAGDAVVARMQLSCLPFVPAHLRTFLEYMSNVIDGLDDDLALRTGGRPAFSPTVDPADADEAEVDEEVPRELLRLEDLEGDVLRDAVHEAAEEGADQLQDLIDAASRAERAARTQREAALLRGDAGEAHEADRRSTRWHAVHGELRQEWQRPDAMPTAFSSTATLYRRFWRRFAAVATERGWVVGKPPPRHWWSRTAGVPGVHWSSSYAKFGCRVELYFGHSDPKVNDHRFAQLVARRDEIQRAYGAEELLFDPLPHAKACRIEARLVGPTIKDSGSWGMVADWMIDRSERLQRAVDSVGGVPS